MRNTIYQVSIQNSLGSAGTSSGFIDNNKVENYMAANSPTTTTTLAQGVDKERGNVRYRSVVETLQGLGTIYISNTVAVGGSATTAPTSFTMTLTVEHGDDSLLTWDELNPGVELSGIPAIKRSIARGLTRTRLNHNCEVTDQTKTTAPQNGGTSGSLARVGSRVMLIDVGALSNSVTAAEATITVTRPAQ